MSCYRKVRICTGGACHFCTLFFFAFCKDTIVHLFTCTLAYYNNWRDIEKDTQEFDVNTWMVRYWFGVAWVLLLLGMSCMWLLPCRWAIIETSGTWDLCPLGIGCRPFGFEECTESWDVTKSITKSNTLPWIYFYHIYPTIYRRKLLLLVLYFIS